MTELSPERIGRVTASRIADMLARTKTGWSTSRDNYAAELIACRLTKKPAPEGYVSAAMQWGTDTEAEAKAAYSFYADAEISVIGDQFGFVIHPNIVMAGATPDGAIGKVGLIQVKCPLTANHLKTLRGAEIDGGYVKQMQFEMACTGRQYCDFVSYDPRMPEHLRLFVKRIKRDQEAIDELEKQTVIFLKELDKALADLNKQYGGSKKVAA